MIGMIGMMAENPRDHDELDEHPSDALQLSRSDIHDSFQTYMARAQYTHPADVLGLDRMSSHTPQAIAGKFRQVFGLKQNEQCSPQDLQNLCSAYLLMVLYQVHKTPQASQQVINNTLNVRADNINITQMYEKERMAMEHRHIQLQEWGKCLEISMLELEAKYGGEMKNSTALKEQLSTLALHYDIMAKRALCAPPFFDALHDFRITGCVQGEDERVSSEDFHQTFTAHLTANHPNIERPSQRDLTALMKRLGFNNEQVYVHGGNARGFHGLGLRSESTE